MKRCNFFLVVGALFPALVMAESGKITGIQFKPGKERAVLILSYQGSAKFRMLQSEKNGTVVVEAENLKLPPTLSRAIGAGGVDGPVMQVTPYAASAKGREISKIVVQLRKKATASISEAAGQFMLEIRGKSLAEIMASEKNAKRVNGFSETDSFSNRAGAPEKGDEVAKKLVAVLNANAEGKEYFGSKVTFEADDASVHDVFRLVGDSSGLNIITDSKVESKDSYSLKDVPWDQLLDIVVTKNQLKAKVTGNVVYIITHEQFSKEQEEKLKEFTAANALEPVVMAVIPLSYAAAADVRRMVDALLYRSEETQQVPVSGPQVARPVAQPNPGPAGPTSGGSFQAGGAAGDANAASQRLSIRQDFKRGMIETDERSNSIVVTNTRETIERIRRLVKELDVALPQVLIDAKIVIANEEFSRNVGVQWGGQMQGTGQSGFGFVSNVAAVPNLTGFNVTGPGNGLGGNFNFGSSATKNLNLSLRLGEINGWSKTLSSPRVIVNNKKTATVKDGENRVLPTQGGVGQAGGIERISADLSLTVTPQVTSSGAVLLDVNVQKTAFVSAETNTTTEKNLTTNVLVNSGSTLVLGGVYQYSKSIDEKGIPLLKDLPFVGQLFRTNSNAENKSELMVFISPQILDPNTPDLGAETAAVPSDKASL